MITIEGYHGTDLECAKKILNSKFVVKRNKQHWLGNGIYFFQDKALSKWWTTNPSNKFGSRVYEPVIIKSIIEIKSKDNFMDLRLLDDFSFFVETYYTEFIPAVRKGIILLNDKTTGIRRCSYCDYLHKQYDIEVIVGNFFLPGQPYLPQVFSNRVKNSCLNLKYIETQICVFNNENIKTKEIILLK